MNLNNPFIIADIGSNHRNDFALALKQIELAKEAGCTAAKFQMYTHKELYGFDGKSDFELPRDWVPKLKEHCDKVGIDFMCSAFSAEGIHFLNPYVSIHKLASCENNHPEMLQELNEQKKKVVVSLGASYEKDVWRIEQELKNCELYFLECVASYPADFREYNLGYLLGGKLWGVSDHTTAPFLALVALGRGARIFESHFDCDPYTGTQTPDFPVSRNVPSFTEYCKLLREFSESKTSHSFKTIQPSEWEILKKHKRRETVYGFYRLK